MTSDRQALFSPRPSRVRADDLQFRKISRYFVYGDGLAVFQFNPHAARSSRARRRHTAVKEDRQPEFRALFPQRIEANVVGEKVLPSGIQFTHAAQPQFLAVATF